MSLFDDDNSEEEILTTDRTEQYSKLFRKLKHCSEDEQRKKIGETNEIVDGMNEEEHKSVFTTRMFKEIHKMIEEKKIAMENATFLLKHVGHCNIRKGILIDDFKESSLTERFDEMIIDENEKEKDEKDERLLIDLCECYLTLGNNFSYELHSICIPCLLNAASNKEENEETQNETEMALLALSKASLKEEQYLKEILEIIEYHREHGNLTRLAYQSAWQFFVHRFFRYEDLEIVIVNELNFAREAV